MLQISKTDIKIQIHIDLEYAENADGVNRAAAVRLALQLASQLTPEERKEIATTHTFARSVGL